MSSLSFWQRTRRTPYQAFASIFMMSVTLFVMAIFLLLALSSSAILRYFESLPQFNVYFNDEKEQASVDQLVSRLKSTGKVSNVSYISKDQALERYREDNKNDPLLLEMVTADILPASLEVSAIAAQDLPELAEMVTVEEGIDEVVFQKESVDTLITWTGMIRRVGIVFTVFLVAETILLLLTIISMKIALKKEEIDILKLVGATPWYIKKPFIYEGIIYGTFGATIAFAAIAGILFYLRPFIASFLHGIPTLHILSSPGIAIAMWPPGWELYLLIWGILTVSGLLIGLFGSYVAASRYLKY